MSYGDVRQYRNRVTRWLAIGESVKSAVGCPACVSAPENCDECYVLGLRHAQVIADSHPRLDGIVAVTPDELAREERTI